MHISSVRHPIGSLFQSCVDYVLRLAGPPGGARPTLTDPHVLAATAVAEHLAAGVSPPVTPPPAVQQAAGGEDAWRCLRLAGDLFLARMTSGSARAAELESEYRDGTCDPRWLEAIEQYLEFYGPSGHDRQVPYVAWRESSDFVSMTLPPSATVLLIGDWGTGTEPAKALLAEAATHAPDIFIHLGDVYYAGTPHEAQANFLDVCNAVFDRSSGHLPIYNLTGNHDMYAGGLGYFALLPKTNPTPPFVEDQQQQASFFCLRNPSGAFQLLGMDTGLHDGDPFTVNTDVTWLEPSEAAWHLDKINEFHEQGGRTILLSHHQLFSAFESIGESATRAPELQAYNPKLLDVFRDVLEAGKVLAWFWGHEHNLGIYAPYGPLKRGRCIGHGAIPVLANSDPYTASPHIAQPPALVRRPDTGAPVQLPLDAARTMYQHGYVILRLNDTARTAQADYYLAGSPAAPFYSEMLTDKA